MIEGEFASISQARKEVKRMIAELYECKRSRIRIIRWEAVTVETHDIP